MKMMQNRAKTTLEPSVQETATDVAHRRQTQSPTNPCSALAVLRVLGVLGGLGVATLSLSTARADTVATVSSPGEVLAVALDLHEGRLSYRIERFGERVVDDSRLGVALRGAEKLERNLSLVSQSTSSVDQRWEQAWGERRWSRDQHRELRAEFAEGVGAKRHFSVVFRVFDDGVGFRYEFPLSAGAGELIIEDELTEFAIAPPMTAWWIPAGEWNRYE